MSWCECGKCHRQFSSVTTFDAHQERHFGTATPIVCHDPAELGMTLDRFGRWHVPETADSRARRQNLRASGDQPSVIGRGQP